MKFKKNLKQSSKKWLVRQHKDLFVKKAKQEGYRSRAAYKLLEIQQKHSFLKPGMLVLDLGAAPGSWSQVAINCIAPKNNKLKGKLLAVDILPIEPIENVDIINGDFTNELIFNKICDKLIKNNNVTMDCDKLIKLDTLTIDIVNRNVDTILSDLAPNLTGIWSIDIPRAMYLNKLALRLVERLLKKGGHFFIKLFNGQGLPEYLSILRKQFSKVIICKPQCSRKESREIYVLAKWYNEQI